MVEVFKTDVQHPEEASLLVAMLKERYPGSRINFDLHDCDKILRIEGKYCIPYHIQALMQQNGYSCSILE